MCFGIGSPLDVNAPSTLTIGPIPMTSHLGWVNGTVSANATLRLMRDGRSFRVITSFPIGWSHTFPAVTIRDVPSGRYSLMLDVSSTGNMGAHIRISVSPFLFERQANFQRCEFGTNGMTAFYAQHHLHFTEQNGLDVRGQTNMPGVLLSGTGNAGGGASNLWGARRHALSGVVRVSLGVYDVFHSVGHREYAVLITPTTANRVATVVALQKHENRFQVEFRTNAGTPALADSAFDFLISGRNYV